MKKPGLLFPAWMLIVVLLSFVFMTGAAIKPAGGLENGGITSPAEAPGDEAAGGAAEADNGVQVKAATDKAAETSPPPPPQSGEGGSIQITGYKVIKGDADPYTGRIKRDNTIAVVVNVLDERIVSGTVKPVAVLNTASFSVPGQGSITYGKTSMNSYGCAYTIIFRDVKFSGHGNTFDFNLYYSNLSLEMQTVSLTLNQCVEYVPPEPEEPPEAPNVTVKGTGFVLRDASYGSGVIYAGKAFTLSATILATNGSAAVENVSVAFSPAEELTLADGSSISYIGTIAPNTSVPVSVTLLPGANIQEGSYIIAIDVNGVNQQTGDPVSAQMTVSVPVLQPERFEIFEAMLPTDLMAGMDTGMGYGSVTLVNMGRGAVSNVSVEVLGDGLSTEEGKQYMGNVGGGEQKTADFNIQADMPGQIKARIVVSYENVRGEQKTLERAFTIEVMEMEEPIFDDPGFEFPGEGEGGGMRSGLPTWLWIVIIAGVACILVAVLVRRRKKRLAAKEAELDEVDYDFEDDDDNEAGADDD
ncbi:MAG: hypothetical protein FWG03_03440 [Clostridiales bacterium]|nr:hypothetical protein [Clostridiales bacterium]